MADTFGYGSNGEPFGGDFDREALVRERRKALAIEPKAPRPQHELALALARDVHGRFLESTDDLVEIVRLARQATESGWEEARPLLLHALLAAHRYSELEALAREEDNAIDGKHRLAAIAMQRGTAETLRELSTLGPSFGSANAILEQTAVLLWTARLYEQAAPLFAETIRRQPDRASLLSERQAYRRNEALVLDLRRPEDVVRAVKQSCVDLRRFVAERGRLLGETLFEGELEDRDRTAYRSTCGTPVGVTSRAALFVDGSLVGSLAGSGDRRSGFQVEQGREGARDEAPRKYFFVMPDRNGRLQLVAADTAEAGREALRQLEAGRMEAAARLVDMGVAMLTTMLRRYKEAGTPDAALSARIVRLRVAWPAVGAPARRDPEALRAAGAMLAGPRFRKLTIPLLEKAFARATGPMRDALGEDLLPQLYAEERFADVVKVIEQLSPESRASFLVHQAQLKALAKLGRDRELDAVVADWRRRGFEEGLVERLLAEHDVETDRLEAAVARLERLVRSPDGEALDHNNLAWYLFALGKDRARAVSLARRSIELSKLRETNRLNTLACALADAGQLDEAIKLTRETRDTPAADPSALSFVLGILAEKMGLPDEARRQYQRAAEGKRRHGPERKSDVPALARARLARLPAP